MSIDQIISPRAIIPALKAATEKSVTLALSKKASAISGLESSEIADALLNQKQDAKQHISFGVAILQITSENTTSSHAIFARLAAGIDFTSVDGEPVDLVLLLIMGKSPTNRHLQTLAETSRLFRNKALCKKLRGSTTADAIYALLTGYAKKGLQRESI